MGTAEFNLLREDLSQWIRSLNDSKLLNFLNSVKLSTSNPRHDWWDDLTEEQKQNIQGGSSLKTFSKVTSPGCPGFGVGGRHSGERL